MLTDITRLKAQQAELEPLLRERELMFSLSEVGIAYLRGAPHRARQPGDGGAHRLRGARTDGARRRPSSTSTRASASTSRQRIQRAPARAPGASAASGGCAGATAACCWVQVSARPVVRTRPSGPAGRSRR
ncbi:MAG: hypothetical protein MZW92_00175 [Comamonadaceae bacterium]|nr:hypothetical protein [Comamonadaceae bacterium]